ncbi:type II toxin-antitoxin system PemK/MazF family toxin [Glutamicibacter sp.]|uniref:type II toxin-antitoxin system PemK/MazF family toxin n=1 Tax=Glutamicibacter sp. TaxID=1931995 RepID=UPI0028BEDE24|nr:type II toxin-antitoxin system PemK/MazF family toxin [Glutamicibacter sp.]
MALNLNKIFEFLKKTLKSLASSDSKGSDASRTTTTAGKPAGAAKYPGDFHGVVHYEYNPNKNGSADPGEIVWGWVPFEEDHSQGKDRPVLIIGRDGKWLLGLMLTSKDKNNSAHHNPNYLDIGTGAWDRERRPSEVKLDRIIRVSQSTVRREGAILEEKRFKTVVNALNQHG